MLRGRWLFTLCLGIILTLNPLWGSLYRSNSLGQALEPIDQESTRYTLEVIETDRGVKRTLYDNGVVIRLEEETSDEGSQEILVREYSPTGELLSETTFVYDGGLPQRIIKEREGELMVTLYAYGDGHLIEEKELINGQLTQLKTYYRGDEGLLSGVRLVDLDGNEQLGTFTKEGSLTLYGEESGQNFATLTYYPNNLVVRNYWVNESAEIKTVVEYDEAGQLVLTEKERDGFVKKTYAPDGMLVEVEEQQGDAYSVKQFFTYDHFGVLDSAVELLEEDGVVRRFERWYKEGELESQTEWLNSTPIKATRFLYDGTTVVTLFEEGRPYADVTYAPDGKRVLSLEYRKER
ncbi:MAG: hypothetical protein WC224_08020 [Sphaerochaetaceae bacterium]